MSVLRFGITPTLLNSYDWLTSCPESWREKSLAELQNTLQRKPFQTSPEAQKGIDLEKAVEKYCTMPDVDFNKIKASGHFRKLLELCHGGDFQQWAEMYFPNPIRPGLPDVRAYGKIDVLKRNKIIDIKTTAKYKGGEYYTKGWQPIIYCLSTGINNFEFLVCVWENVNSMLIKDFHIVRYELKAGDEKRLIKRYHEFIEFLKQKELYQDYLETYMKNTLSSTERMDLIDGNTFHQEPVY
jgi:hypothetical protein